jgi:effector-binding domain-containing protein
MLETPQLLRTNEQLTSVIHLLVPRSEISIVMGPAITEILSALAAQQTAPSGPCFSYHLQRPTDIFDFEVGFPVSQAITPIGRVKMSKLPAANIARATYQGNYAGLAAAWGEFCAWLDSEGLKPQESLWEYYLVGHETSSDPNEWRTELNRPLSP